MFHWITKVVDSHDYEDMQKYCKPPLETDETAPDDNMATSACPIVYTSDEKKAKIDYELI